MIKVKDLQVVLKGEKILEDINFELKKGEVLAILGPNGAGKTVLLKVLLDLLPYKGEVKWKKGARVGYVPQRVPFVKDLPLSVEDFFRLKKASSRKINEVLKTVGFKGKDILSKELGNVSSGQFQRVLIAWSLIGNPKVLLFDEPTAGVDIGSAKSVYHILDKLRKEKGMTIILITHDLSVVYDKVNRVICLNKKMVCNESPKQLTAHHLSELFGGKASFYTHKHKHAKHYHR